MPMTVRPYRAEDLGRILQLWERAGCIPNGPDGLAVDQVLDVMTSERGLTLVAESEGETVGMVTTVVAGAVAWIVRLAVAQPAEGGEVAQGLLEQVEARLGGLGVRRLVAMVQDDHPDRKTFLERGFQEVPAIRHLERDIPATVGAPGNLARLGGRMIHPDLWRELRGMEEPKAIIERRVILPLAEPALATRHAVSPPMAIVLFGPPGTGKTTFAKGIASRLGWPFVEIEPGELAGEGPDRQAKLLAETFELIIDLPAAVVFVDEVEDLASIRHEERRASPSVTNEFLKQIPRLREASHHLLVCATNWVGRLDPAFLRPGRFDYVLPVGPPDEDARRAIWRRYAEEITDQEVDLDRLVAASAMFTPADIEFAARKAAQKAFEREHFEGRGHRATTSEFLTAISETKPTLSQDILASFSSDTERFARY
jgi:N-acetylglutamate synthase-like GNAT family acetyltransferase